MFEETVKPGAGMTIHLPLKRFFLLNPFTYDRPSPNVMVDPVLRRHAGQEVKTGVSYPVGLGYMAGALILAGYEVRMCDPMATLLPVEELHRNAQWSDAIIVPFSFSHACDITKFFKNFPDKVRIGCGVIAECLCEELLQQGAMDIVLIGEPEHTVVELAQRYPGVADVKGIAYRAADGSVTVTNPRMQIEDLDSLPFPYRDYCNPRVYWEIFFWGQPTAWILPSRGCPYRCVFCSQAGSGNRRVRYRSPVNVVDEIEHVYRRYGIKCITFADETFNVNPAFMEEICKEILRRDLCIEWVAAARADIVAPEVLDLARRSGCVGLTFGLESADDTILQYLQKGTTLSRMREGLDQMRQAGVNYSLQCIFGSPMENEDTIRRTLAFVREMRPLFASFNVLTPLPGSELYDQAKMEVGRCDSLESFDILHTQYSLCRYTPGQLQEIIRKAYRSFYLSPRFAIRLLWECMKHPKLFYWIFLYSLPKQAVYVFRSILQR